MCIILWRMPDASSGSHPSALEECSCRLDELLGAARCQVSRLLPAVAAFLWLSRALIQAELLDFAGCRVQSCCLQSEFHGVRAEMEKEAMRAAKLDQRLAVLTKGYVTREAALRKGIEFAWQALQAAQQVRACPASHLACAIASC